MIDQSTTRADETSVRQHDLARELVERGIAVFGGFIDEGLSPRCHDGIEWEYRDSVMVPNLSDPATAGALLGMLMERRPTVVVGVYSDGSICLRTEREDGTEDGDIGDPPALGEGNRPCADRGEPVTHHKRGRAKNQRAGCLLCKPHKANGADRRTLQEMRADARPDHYADEPEEIDPADFDDDDPDTPERYWSDWLEMLYPEEVSQ